jgi:hypothetical protein
LVPPSSNVPTADKCCHKRKVSYVDIQQGGGIPYLCYLSFIGDLKIFSLAFRRTDVVRNNIQTVKSTLLMYKKYTTSYFHH